MTLNPLEVIASEVCASTFCTVSIAHSLSWTVTDSHYRDVCYEESDDEGEDSVIIAAEPQCTSRTTDELSAWCPDPRVQEELQAMSESDSNDHILSTEKLAKFGYTGRTEDDTGTFDITNSITNKPLMRTRQDALRNQPSQDTPRATSKGSVPVE